MCIVSSCYYTGTLLKSGSYVEYIKHIVWFVMKFESVDNLEDVSNVAATMTRLCLSENPKMET